MMAARGRRRVSRGKKKVKGCKRGLSAKARRWLRNKDNQNDLIKRIRKFMPLLKRFRVAGPAERRRLIKGVPEAFLRTLSECSGQVIHRRQKVSPVCAELLQPHIASLRSLAEARTSNREMKKIVSQKGGFLPILLSSLFGGLLSDFIKS